MRVFLTGADGYIGAIMGPKLLEAGHEVMGPRHRLLPPRLALRRRPHPSGGLLRRPAEHHRGRPRGASTPSSTSPSSPTTRSARTTPASPWTSTTRARSAWRGKRARRGCALHPGLVLLDLRRRRRRDAHRDERARTADRLRPLQDPGGERVRELMDDRFTPVFMRNATAYGASPRQRFDLVLNNLCGFAHTIGEIRMTSDGSPWRPITHIEDICEAMLCALKAPRTPSPARRSTWAPTRRTTASARSPRSWPRPSRAAR